MTALILALATGTTAFASPHPGSSPSPPLGSSTVRVSVDQGGADADGESFGPSVSSDGRYVAFASDAGDLVPQVGNPSYPDVFRRDVATGATVLVSADMSGGVEEEGSTAPSIDGAGDVVAFQSYADDLVPNDRDNTSDVFVRNLTTNVTTKVSVALGGADPDGRSTLPSISSDGIVVAFQSYASNLVAGDANGAMDVFVRNLSLGTTTRVSVDMSGGDPDGGSYDPSISSDGRYVAFHSSATDLVAGDLNGASDVFLRDLVAGTTVRASTDSHGGDPNDASYQPSVNADGRWVAFWSYASDLVQADTNGDPDVFLWDRTTGATVRASLDQGGGNPDAPSYDPTVSGDGGSVAFWSPATDVVAGDTNGKADAFVWDRSTGTTVLASVDPNGQSSDGASYDPAVSSDGRTVAFWSEASDLVSGDGNALADVFLRDLGALPSGAPPGRNEGASGGPGTQGVALPDTGAYFGAFVDTDPHRGLDRLGSDLGLESITGRTMGLERVYYAWDDSFPTPDDEASRDHGRTLILSWTSHRADGTPIRWADVSSGALDGELHAMAARIKGFGAPTFLSFHHEPDSHHMETEEQNGTAAEYAAAWRHIHDLFAADAVTNVTWVWILMSWTFYAPRPDLVGDTYWPGSAYVDVVGSDGYNWWGCEGHNGPWRSPREVFEPWYEFARTKGKPMMITEWASGEDQATVGRKGQWIQEAMDTFKSWPEIKGIAYFETANRQKDCARWVDTSSSSLAAYTSIGASPYFNPIPSATITAGPAAHTVDADASFTFGSTRQGSTFTCSLDQGSAVPCSSPQTYTGLPQGAHTFTVTAANRGGVQSNPVTWTWNVDPIVSSIDVGPDDPSASTSATFVFSASDPQATFTCSLDGETSACTSPITYDALSVADHAFTVQAKDGQGNLSAANDWAWTVAAASATVSAKDDVFQPRKVAVSQGGVVAWTFDGTHDHTVTDGSGLGLFDSGTRPPSSAFTLEVPWAGTYRYVCTIHPAMKGQITVAPTADPTSGHETTVFELLYATTGTPLGTTFDVQIKRPGSNAWVTWRFGQVVGSVNFTPDAGTGTYSFRVRLESSVTGAVTTYSPSVSITVTP